MNKYINSFKTVEDYNAYVSSDEYATPNVAFIAENNNFESSGGDKVETIIIGNGGDDETVKGIIDRSITKCDIPQGTTSIGKHAFSNCSGLTSVMIPDSVTSIGKNAFYQCSGLTTVTIGNGVTIIDHDAFNLCTSLATVTINATIPPELGRSAIYGKNITAIYVPSNSVDAYKSDINWDGFADRIFPIK